MKKIKNGIKKVKFNKAQYNNVLEANPQIVLPVSNDIIQPSVKGHIEFTDKYTFIRNEYSKEQMLYSQYYRDEIFDSKAYDLFYEKCEKELFNYVKYFTDAGDVIFSRGKYDAGKRNSVLYTGEKKKTHCIISPKDNAISLIHSCLERYMVGVIARFYMTYEFCDEENYNRAIQRTDELDYFIRPPFFTCIPLLHLDIDSFRQDKERIIKGEKKKLVQNFEKIAKKVFILYDVFSTERQMPWNKDEITRPDIPGLYPLIEGIWGNVVHKYFVKLNIENNLEDLNNDKLPLSFYKNKIKEACESDKDLFKATIPEKLNTATPRVLRLVDVIRDMFIETLNEVLINVESLISSWDDRASSDFNEFYKKNFKDVQKDIIEKHTKEIDGKNDEIDKLQKENEELKEKYNTLSKETDIDKIKNEKKKYERQLKDKDKKIRELTSRLNKESKEHQAELSMLKALQADDEILEVPLKKEEVPEIPKDFTIAFCMEKKEGFEKTSIALLEEFPTSIVAYKPDQITNQDIVVYLTERMSHGYYEGVKNAAKSKGIPEWHTALKNPSLIRETLARYLHNKEKNNA